MNRTAFDFEPLRAANRPPTVALTIGVYATTVAIILTPVLSIRVPALCDYLTHLARMHILLDIDHSAALRRFYSVQWRPLPYLGMDSLFVVVNRGFVLLHQRLALYEAGRGYIALCVVLPLASAAILHHAIHRRVSLIPLAAAVFSYNFLLAWGFVNYLPAICLAVIVLAMWIRTSGWPRWRRAALFCAPATLLYLFHLMAFAGYCVAVAGYEVALAAPDRFRPWRSVMSQWSAAALQAAPAVALALCVHVDSAVGAVATVYGAMGKATVIASPVLFFATPIDRCAGAFGALVLALGLLTGRLRVAPVVWGPLLAVLAAAAAMPNVVHGIFGMDYRLPLMLVLILIGGVTASERAGRIVGTVTVAGIVAVTAARSIEISGVLQRLDGQIAEVRQVLATMPRGQRLLLAMSPISAVEVPMRRATLHIGMLAVVDRDAFVPYLCTAFLTVHPASAMLSASSMPGGGSPLSLADLRAGFGRRDDRAPPLGDGMGGRVYWMGWERKFDYLLYEHYSERSPVMPPGLHRVAASSVADLYRIDR